MNPPRGHGVNKFQGSPAHRVDERSRNEGRRQLPGVSRPGTRSVVVQGFCRATEDSFNGNSAEQRRVLVLGQQQLLGRGERQVTWVMAVYWRAGASALAHGKRGK
jgi:hypothetical protein